MIGKIINVWLTFLCVSIFSTSLVAQLQTGQVTQICDLPSQYEYSKLTCVDNNVYFHFSPDENYTPTHIFQIVISGAFTGTIYGPFQTLSEGVNAINNNTAVILLSISGNNASNFNANLIKSKVYILKLYKRQCNGTISFSRDGKNIYECTNNVGEIDCESCLPKFNPPIGKYILSAWVKEDNPVSDKTTYTHSSIQIRFSSINQQFNYLPSGPIIDGWQKIEAIVNITTIADFQMILRVGSGVAYFDDIRLYPYDGSMISYVYDPLTLRLVAELDERNFAKIYEYDEEGKLIRIKKETEKGIMTIQETRENSFKK